MKIVLLASISVIFLLPITAAQDNLDEELAKLESALDELDSASLLFILDSLIKLEEARDYQSFLTLRAGYMSQVVSAGRDLNLNQFGLSYGIAYFHHSGFFADVTGYSNSAIDPQYYLNIVSAGYLGSIGQHWTYLLNYDRYFYNRAQEANFNTLYSNGLGVSVYAENDLFESGLDYSVILGDTITAHRVVWSTNATLTFKNFLFFDKVTLLPTFRMLFGNATSFLRPFRETDIEALQRRLIQSNQRLRNLLNDPEALRRAIEEINTFGLLNYSLSLPVSFKKNAFDFLVSYQFNIPQELPGQSEDLIANSFIQASLSYTFKF